LNQEFEDYIKDIEYEMSIKNVIQSKTKEYGDKWKNELLIVRKIILNSRLVNQYKERLNKELDANKASFVITEEEFEKAISSMKNDQKWSKMNKRVQNRYS